MTISTKQKEFHATPNSRTTKRPNATSRGFCANCQKEIRWSIAGWVHGASGSALCVYPPESSVPQKHNKGENQMNKNLRTAGTSKKSASKPSTKKLSKAQRKAVERHQIDPQMKLVKTVEKNPRRKDTFGFQSFAKIKNGMTVAEAKKRGARAKDIQWDIRHGYLKLVKKAS